MYDSGTAKVRIYYCAWTRDGGPASHDLLQSAVEADLGRIVRPFSVCRDKEYGKPFIKDLPEVHFSITHSGGFWVCAIGEREVGLDLQEVRDRNTEPIARRFFHPSEIAWLRSHSDPDEFFRIWASKESYVKYTGEGLTKGLDYFSVVDGAPAYQQEVPFREGYFLILTTETEADVCLTEMPNKTAGCRKAAEQAQAARDREPGGAK